MKFQSCIAKTWCTQINEFKKNFLQTGVDLLQNGFSQEGTDYLSHEVLRLSPNEHLGEFAEKIYRADKGLN